MSKRLAQIGIIAAVYAVLTLFLAPISYGNIQFRLSEVLTLLEFFNPAFIPGLTLGTFIANLMSPLGLIDIIFGTLATFISVFMMSKMKHLFIASLWPVAVNGVIIGLELNYLFQLPLWLTVFQVAFGEFVVVTLIGVMMYKKFFIGRDWFEKMVE
jgi:uncharacterized membrane protein